MWLLGCRAGLGQAGISGCIMFEETLYQSTAGGTPFVDVLREQGIVPGIKVDTGGCLQTVPRLPAQVGSSACSCAPFLCALCRVLLPNARKQR